MAGNCTLKDIADELGITTSTVSRVLNDVPSAKIVSESTRKKIKETVERLGYVPNINARRLVKEKSSTIGIVLPGYDIACPSRAVLSDRSLGTSLGGVETALKGSGYRMLLIFRDEKFVERKEHLRLFKEKSIDGMIVWGARNDESFWNEAAAENVVMINTRNGAGSPIAYVGNDNFTAAYDTTRMLLAQGRKRIIFFNSYPAISIPYERLAGHRKALEDAGIPFDGNLLFEGSPDQCVERMIAAYESKSLDFNAVQCTNDGEAAYCGVELLKRGCKVPEDIFIAGGERFYDRHHPLFLWKFPMSSFVIDYNEIGRAAAQWILEGVNGRRPEPRTLLLRSRVCQDALDLNA